MKSSASRDSLYTVLARAHFGVQEGGAFKKKKRRGARGATTSLRRMREGRGEGGGGKGGKGGKDDGGAGCGDGGGDGDDSVRVNGGADAPTRGDDDDDDDPSRCVVLLLWSRKVPLSDIRKTVKGLGGAMPSKRAVAAAEGGGGKPLTVSVFANIGYVYLLLPSFHGECVGCGEWGVCTCLH
jgi:hypothetical protein